MNETLIARIEEECEDVETYAKLHEEAEENGYDMLAAKLKSIAYDEYTHAFTLKSCLEKWGVDIGAAAREKFEKARAIFKDL